MGEDEGEEINAEVGKDVTHPPVGVHGAVDDLSGDARQQQGCGQNSGLGLLLHLEEQDAMSCTANPNIFHSFESIHLQEVVIKK